MKTPTPQNRADNPDQDYCRICGEWVGPGDQYRVDADHIWHAACEKTNEST